MKYEIKITSQFKKDFKLAKKQGKNIEKLFFRGGMPCKGR